MSVSELQALATRAMDAAKDAGASYADVRVAEQHSLGPVDKLRVFLDTRCAFGVRALVDGVWGFAYGRLPTADAIVQCAQEAVSAGRVAARLTTLKGSTLREDWIPAPVATGEWRMPIRVDPFAIPIQQHAEQLDVLTWTIERTPGASANPWTQWTRETRVFAATTGSVLTQHLYRADVQIGAQVRYGQNHVNVQVPGIHCASTGYEILLAPDGQDRCKIAAEEAVWLSRLPMRPLDVGRYPVIFDGHVMGDMLITIVGPSGELDRVLGHDINEKSPWSLDLLGSPVAGSLMTVTGHRAMPSMSAVQWDDEGAAPQEHVLIRDGMLHDYHTSGQTVSALKSWYAQQGYPLHSNGCAVAVEAQKTVATLPPHLAMMSSTSRMGLEEMYKEMNRGVVVMTNGQINTDQQLVSGSISSGSMLFEISRGKIVRRLKNMALQFNTTPFLKGLTAVGDQTTVCHQDGWRYKGMPWQESRQSATAPAGMFKEVNVISTGGS